MKKAWGNEAHFGYAPINKMEDPDNILAEFMKRKTSRRAGISDKAFKKSYMFNDYEHNPDGGALYITIYDDRKVLETSLYGAYYLGSEAMRIKLYKKMLSSSFTKIEPE